MSVNDDDRPEDEASESERREAERLGTALDDLLAGKGMPAIAEVEERELLQLSSMVHAAHHEVPLAEDRVRSLIDAALVEAVPVAAQDGQFTEDELGAARERRKSRTWVYALGGALAAAAALLLFLRGPQPEQESQAPVAITEPLPLEMQSRPSDELVGRIDPSQSAMARSRIDQIYGDRLSGYRAVQYRRLVGKQ